MKWFVVEIAYDKVIGYRRFLTKLEAETTAAVWRGQSAGIVAIGRC